MSADARRKDPGLADPGRIATQALRAAVQDGDAAAIARVLAADVEFASPAFAEPTVGRERVAPVLATARQLYAGLAFTGELADGDRGALLFEASVGGERLQGCYWVRAAAEGTVARIDALFRPVTATQYLVREMMDRLVTREQA